MRYDEPTCDHEFILEEPRFIFEDVLVNEIIVCEREFCDETETRQFEVDFDSFVVNGEPVETEEDAYDYWVRVCEEVTEYEHFHSPQDGGVVELEYENDDLTAVTARLEDDVEIKFKVDFYRQL